MTVAVVALSLLRGLGDDPYRALGETYLYLFRHAFFLSIFMVQEGFLQPSF